MTTLGVIIGFSAENTQSIQLSFLDFKTPSLPIFAWLVISFVFGVILTLTMTVLLPLLPFFARKNRKTTKK